jgi:hypothetical protein
MMPGNGSYLCPNTTFQGERFLRRSKDPSERKISGGFNMKAHIAKIV